MKNDKIKGKNCDIDHTKFLENKRKRDNNIGRKWKPYKYMTYEEKKRLADKAALKDHMRQEIRNNPKILKNLDFDKKSINYITKPGTPHNTSQFLSTNFCLGRNERVTNSEIFSEVPLKSEVEVDLNEEADEFCIPGGSMRDILNKEIGRIVETQDQNEPVLVENLSASNTIEELNNFKLIIESQEKLISHLITILNREENKNNTKNSKIP